MSCLSANQGHMHSLFENEEDALFNLFAKGGDHLHYLFETKKARTFLKNRERICVGRDVRAAY